MNLKSKKQITLNNEFRKIPSVERILSNNQIVKITDALSRGYVTKVIQKELAKLKSESVEKNLPLNTNFDEIIQIIKEQLKLETNFGPQNVINATGVILHTNLGRSTLSKEAINSMIDIANNYNLDCLVETHTYEELKRAINIGYPLIGINNRNLDDLTVDINNTLNLIKIIPDNFTVVAESGIKNRDDINKYNDVGVFNFLIGESILKSKNISDKIKEFIN